MRTMQRSTAPQHDLTVYSRDERQILVVEITSSISIESQHLERVRKRLMEHPASERAQFFMLVQRNGLFLWRRGAEREESAEVASVKTLLRNYCGILPDPEESLRKSGLEILFYGWLDDLVAGIRKPKPDSEADQLLVKAGVYDSMYSGRVVWESI